MKKLAIISLTVLLTSCTGWQAVKTAVQTYGVEAADESLTSSLWFICEGTTKGASDRKFKTAEEKAALAILCGGR